MRSKPGLRADEAYRPSVTQPRLLAHLVPLIGPLLGGCISNTPVDLALASVQAVDWRDQNEISGPVASPLIGLVGTRHLAMIGESVTGGEKLPRLLLKIEFTSATNLAKFVTDNSYNLGSNAYFCNHTVDAFHGLAFPSIYWRGTLLGQHEADPIQRHGGDGDEPINYYFFTNVARQRVAPSNPPQEAFDLRQKSEDICFQLRGGNSSGFGYKSNVVVIPKLAIEEALRKLPPGFGG